MSYILKALARSERERKRLRSPDLRDVVDNVEEPPQQPRSSLVLLVFLLANTLLLGAILLIRSQGSDPGPPQTQGHSEPPPVTPIAESRREPEPATTAKAERTAPEAADSSSQRADTQTRAAMPPVTRPLLVEAQPPPRPSASRPAPIGTEPAPAQLAMSEPGIPEPDESLAGVEQVDSLPGIEITVHVYADDPQRRFAYLNGIRYVEGDTLRSSGARLERITKDGVVIDLGDRRALLTVGR